MAAVPPPGLVPCPSCRASVPAGSKFCPSCGAAMGPSANPPAAPAGPVDLRERVDQDRGTLKRLELLIPGYHGYRRDEDIRAADSLLRRQIADRLRNDRFTAENARTAMTQAGQFAALTDLAPLIADLMQIEPKVRSAEQGYSGIAAAIKVGPEQLDRLYEYDYGFVVAADQFSTTLATLPGAVAAQNWAQAQSVCASARAQLAQLLQAFGARTRVVEGIQV